MEAWSPRDRQGSARAPLAVRAQGQGVPLTARAPRSAAVTGRPLGLLPSWPGRCAEGGRASFFFWGNLRACLHPTRSGLKVIAVNAGPVVGGGGGAAARVRGESGARVGAHRDPILAAGYGAVPRGGHKASGGKAAKEEQRHGWGHGEVQRKRIGLVLRSA
jgi:hypothetical protein